jgi:hypothetical protein
MASHELVDWSCATDESEFSSPPLCPDRFWATSYQIVAESPFSGIKSPERLANNSPPSNASFTSMHIYGIVQRLIDCQMVAGIDVV